jgi:membrane protease YdiL (CAAX protease family)
MTQRNRLDIRGIGLYVGLAFGLAWLAVSPLWLSGAGLRHPLTGVLLPLMMFTPAIATLIVVALARRPQAGIVTATGLRLGKGRRWGWYWLLAWTVPALLAIAAPFVGALFGLFPLDITEFSGFRELLEAAGQGAVLEQVPIQVIIGGQLLSILLAPALNALFTFGEEWGWRGYLLPALLPLGQWPALLISGAIWGLWHAPVILLGYNYPQHPQLGVLLMTAFCVIIGVLFGWTRLATGSVWPAVIAHGALNGAAAAPVLFAQAGAPYDTALVGITGVTGWILPLALIGLLVGLRRLPVPDAPDLAWAADADGATPVAREASTA